MIPYKTVKSAANDEFTEKKSRFIGYISPVCNEEEAVSFVNSIKKLHPSARHNVYAYTVRDGNITRYSDDGEPQGTGGIPILEVHPQPAGRWPHATPRHARAYEARSPLYIR